jgi:hypothetical protein
MCGVCTASLSITVGCGEPRATVSLTSTKDLAVAVQNIHFFHGEIMAEGYNNRVIGTLRAVNATRLVDSQAIMAKTVSRDYKNELTSGDSPTISIKIPGRGKIIEGRVTNNDFQLQTNAVVKGSLTKKTLPIEIGELDASTTIEEWTAEVMNPIKENFSTDINKMVLAAIFAGVDSHVIATAGNANFKDLSNAIAKVVKSRVYGKRYGALDPAIMSQVRTSGQNLFNGGTVVNDLYKSFDIANYADTEFIGTPDVEQVVYPSAFPSAISGAVANNAKQIPISALTPLTEDIPEGVLFTIDGVYKVDAEGNTVNGQLKTFVTAKTPAGSGFINLNSAIIFTPETMEGGRTATQVKNVSSLPATAAALTLVGTPGKTYLRGVIYSENIAAIANRPLTEKGKVGIVSTTTLAGMPSIQYWERTGDIANGDIWQSVSRLDAAFPLLGIGGTAYYVEAA